MFWLPSVLDVQWLRMPGTIFCIDCCITREYTSISIRFTMSLFLHLECKQNMRILWKHSSLELAFLLELLFSVIMWFFCGHGWSVAWWKPLTYTVAMMSLWTLFIWCLSMLGPVSMISITWTLLATMPRPSRGGTDSLVQTLNSLPIKKKRRRNKAWQRRRLTKFPV